MTRIRVTALIALAGTTLLAGCSPVATAPELTSQSSCAELNALDSDTKSELLVPIINERGVVLESSAVAAICAQNEGDVIDAAISEALNGVASEVPVDTANEATTSAVELTAHSGVYQGDGGFQQTLTMRTSSVLSGADMAAVQAAWESVGGTGSVPCADQSISGTGSTAYVFAAETAGFAVGTIEITNDVPDFDAKPWKFNITGPNSNLGGSMFAVQYANKTDCAALGTVLISPAWSSGETSWGPTPFVLGVANYRSPEAPDGDAALLEVPIQVLTGPTGNPPLEFVLDR